MDVKQVLDLDRLSKHFDKIGEFVDGVFGDLSADFRGSPEQSGVSVKKEKGDGSPMVIVEIEVPGCSASEVNVEVTAGRLVVQWTPKMTGKDQVRTFSLSKSADVDAVSAKVTDGYLTVTIPGMTGRTPTRKVATG